MHKNKVSLRTKYNAYVRRKTKKLESSEEYKSAVRASDKADSINSQIDNHFNSRRSWSFFPLLNTHQVNQYAAAVSESGFRWSIYHLKKSKAILSFADWKKRYGK